MEHYWNMLNQTKEQVCSTSHPHAGMLWPGTDTSHPYATNRLSFNAPPVTSSTQCPPDSFNMLCQQDASMTFDRGWRAELRKFQDYVWGKMVPPGVSHNMDLVKWWPVDHIVIKYLIFDY